MKTPTYKELPEIGIAVFFALSGVSVLLMIIFFVIPSLKCM